MYLQKISRAFLRIKHQLLILVFSFAAILVHGYQFAVTDQAIFIPYILKISDSNLYPNDLLFQQNSSSLSLFYLLMSHLIKYFDIQAVFFVGYIVFQIIFFTGVYKLAIIFTQNKSLAYISLVPFLLPKFIGGTNTFTFDTFFGYRAFGLVLFIYYLIFLLRKKIYKVSLFAGLGMLFHPLSIIPNILILPAAIIFLEKKSRVKKLVVSYLIFGIVTIPLFFISNATIGKLSQHIKDGFWYQVIRDRNDFLFPSNWRAIEYLSVIFYLIVILSLISHFNPINKKVVKIIIFTSLTVFICNWILLDILKIPLFAQFQLVRSVSPLSYLALVTTPLFLKQKKVASKIIGLTLILSLGLNIYWLIALSTAILTILRIRSSHIATLKISIRQTLIILFAIFFLYALINIGEVKNIKQKFQIPKQINPWIDVQLWAKKNTPRDSTFAVLPRQIGFRIFSQRPIIADLKDGAVVIYDPDYAKKWSEINIDFKNFYNLSESDFLLLKMKYNFDYLVTINPQILNFEVAYRNNYYVVYKP